MKIYEPGFIDSTNAYAKKIIKEQSEAMPFAVRADYQTAGKGQGSNHWESEAKENLLCSIVLKPHQILAEEQFLISQIVSVSLLELLSEFSSGVSIKWPNDLYIGDKKVAGILIENVVLGVNIEHCIIGIGLNVNQKHFSESLPNPTSLFLESHRSFEVAHLLEQLISRIDYYFANREEVPSKYESNLYRKGEDALFYDVHQNAFQGRILGVNKIGQLLIQGSGNQDVREFSNQEVQFALSRW